MQGVEDWGSQDLCHKHNLSRLIADRDPREVNTHACVLEFWGLARHDNACCVGLAWLVHQHDIHGDLQAAANGPALIMVNYELPRALMERLWFNASVRVCAVGAINRLYSTFDTDEERARFIPEFVRGDLDSVEDAIIEYYRGHGTRIVKDHDQDTTDLEKCILLIQQFKVKVQ